jgi:hypothetical protein
MKAWFAFWIGILASLLGLTFLKNWKMNQEQNWKWISTKSIFDWALIVSAAVWLPPLLVAWSCVWIIRPIKHPAARATASVIVTIILGICALEALEVLAVLSIFSIDSVTGKQGFLGNLASARQKDKERSLRAA